MTLTADQTDLFVAGEGDRWFQRNAAALQDWDESTDPCLRLLALNDVQPRRVLEIGAANGRRLAALAARFGATCVGVDASGAAIADGRARYPYVRFIQATADAIRLNEVFDLVIVCSVLHWVDRRRLLATVAEVDRLIEDPGLLLLADFLPDRPTRVPYHHLPAGQAFTFKQDYAAIFCSTPAYQRVGMLTCEQATRRLSPHAVSHERFAAWLLRKATRCAYHTAELPE